MRRWRWKDNRSDSCSSRDLLARTGTPQGTPADEHIGPLPNVQAALEASVPAECLAAQQQTAQP